MEVGCRCKFLNFCTIRPLGRAMFVLCMARLDWEHGPAAIGAKAVQGRA